MGHYIIRKSVTADSNGNATLDLSNLAGVSGQSFELGAISFSSQSPTGGSAQVYIGANLIGSSENPQNDVGIADVVTIVGNNEHLIVQFSGITPGTTISIAINGGRINE